MGMNRTPVGTGFDTVAPHGNLTNDRSYGGESAYIPPFTFNSGTSMGSGGFGGSGGGLPNPFEQAYQATGQNPFTPGVGTYDTPGSNFDPGSPESSMAYFFDPASNPYQVSPAQGFALNNLANAAGNLPPDPMSNPGWGMLNNFVGNSQYMMGPGNALSQNQGTTGYINDMLGYGNQLANQQIPGVVPNQVQTQFGINPGNVQTQFGINPGNVQTQFGISPDRVQTRNFGIDPQMIANSGYGITPPQFNMPGMNQAMMQTPVTTQQIDPSAAIAQGQNFMNRIASPQAQGAMQAAGMGRGGATAEALANAGAQISLPISQQVLASQAAANQQTAALAQAAQQGNQGTQLAQNVAQYQGGIQGGLGYAGLGLQGQALNAQLAQQANLANQAAGLQGQTLNAQFRQQGQLANQAAGLQGQSLNAQLGLQGQLANQGMGYQGQLANAQLGMQGQLANQGMGYQSQLANSQLGMQGQLANQGAGLQAGALNTQNLLNQRQQALGQGQFSVGAGQNAINQALQQQGQQMGFQTGLNTLGQNLAMGIPTLQNNYYNTGLQGANTQFQAASFPQQMAQAGYGNNLNLILSLMGATPLPQGGINTNMSTAQNNPGAMSTAGNLALMASLMGGQSGLFS